MSDNIESTYEKLYKLLNEFGDEISYQNPNYISLSLYYSPYHIKYEIHDKENNIIFNTIIFKNDRIEYYINYIKEFNNYSTHYYESKYDVIELKKNYYLFNLCIYQNIHIYTAFNTNDFANIYIHIIYFLKKM
jgi:hypothetical protein